MDADRCDCAKGRNKFDSHPGLVECADFDDFKTLVLGHRSRAKHLDYVCAPMSDGHRCKESALPRRWLPFDLDGIADGEAFSELLQWFQPLNGFAYTTASSTREAPRCRVIVELSREVGRAEGVRLGKAIEAAITAALGEGRLKFDGSVYRAEQPVYLPTVGCQTYQFDGEAVDVGAWLANAPEGEPERPGAAERAERIASGDPVVRTLYERNMVKKDMEPGKLAVVCPCSDSHTSESNETSTVYMLPMFGGVKYGKFRCLHAHCENRPHEQFLEALGLNPREVWREQVNGGPGVDCSGLFDDEAGSDAPHGEGGDSPRTGGEWLRLEDWRTSPRFDGEPPPREWLVDGVFPLGKAALLAAAGGIGKSFLLLELVYRVATPGGEIAGVTLGHFAALGLVKAHGTAVLLCAEDDAIEVHHRLNGLGGPVDGLIVVALPDAGGVRSLFTLDEKGRSPATTMHFHALAEQLRALPDVRLICFDPLQALCGGLDLNLPQHAQHVCGELAKLAAETGAAVIVSHHFRKGGEIESPEQAREAVRGSGGLVDGVRSVVAVWPDGEQTAKATCRTLGQPWERGKVCRAAVVKANFRADLRVQTLVRDESGLLVNRSFELGQMRPDAEQVHTALVEAIAQAGKEGEPFTKTGQAGIHAQRHRLPRGFHEMPRARLEGITDELLSAGRLKQFRRKPSEKHPAWLDVPDGVLSRVNAPIPEAENVTEASHV